VRAERVGAEEAPHEHGAVFLTNCGLDRIFRAACDARPAVPD